MTKSRLLSTALRRCLKIIGPGVSSMMATPTNSNIGNSRNNMVEARMMSKIRLIASFRPRQRRALHIDQQRCRFVRSLAGPDRTHIAVRHQSHRQRHDAQPFTDEVEVRRVAPRQCKDRSRHCHSHPRFFDGGAECTDFNLGDDGVSGVVIGQDRVSDSLRPKSSSSLSERTAESSLRVPIRIANVVSADNQLIERDPDHALDGLAPRNQRNGTPSPTKKMNEPREIPLESLSRNSTSIGMNTTTSHATSMCP